MATVGFLHVAYNHVRSARRLLAEHAPELVDLHLVDRKLIEPSDQVRIRVATRVGELVGREVDAIVCTWPALLADVVTAARALGTEAIGLEELIAAPLGTRALAAGRTAS